MDFFLMSPPSLPDKRQIDSHATIIDFLIDVVFLPERIRHRKFLQALLNGHLGLNVSDVIPFEGCPLLRRVIWIVSGPLAICLCRSTGLAEVLDEVFSFSELLFFQTEDGTDTFEG